jgi:hypothetical protein
MEKGEWYRNNSFLSGSKGPGGKLDKKQKTNKKQKSVVQFFSWGRVNCSIRKAIEGFIKAL